MLGASRITTSCPIPLRFKSSSSSSRVSSATCREAASNSRNWTIIPRGRSYSIKKNISVASIGLWAGRWSVPTALRLGRRRRFRRTTLRRNGGTHQAAEDRPPRRFPFEGGRRVGLLASWKASSQRWDLQSPFMPPRRCGLRPILSIARRILEPAPWRNPPRAERGCVYTHGRVVNSQEGFK